MGKRFGEFEFDETGRRLTRRGRLTGQALDLLAMLVDQSGELVTREEIKRLIWPDTSQNLDHSLDVLVNRLRRVLGDNGKTPQYIETVPRRGFRFLATVSRADAAAEHADFAGFPSGKLVPARGVLRKLVLLVAIVLLAALGGILFARTRYKRFVPPLRSSEAWPTGKVTEMLSQLGNAVVLRDAASNPISVVARPARSLDQFGQFCQGFDDEIRFNLPDNIIGAAIRLSRDPYSRYSALNSAAYIRVHLVADEENFPFGNTALL